MAEIKDLSKNNFDEFIKGDVVLVDFWASWCMPCLMMTPIFEELSEIFKGKVMFGKLHIEENQDIAQKYDVSSIPTFILFKKGKQAHEFIGSTSVEDFEEKLKRFV